MKNNILLSIFVLFCFSNLFAQTDFKEIDRFIENEMKNWHIPNVSIAITNKDSMLYIKEYGNDSSKGNYLIGSVSKPFTAIAVMQLVEKGKLNLDAPVKDYLSWFETKNKEVSNKITIRHLLNQTSGLPKNAGFFTPQSTNQQQIEQDYQNYLLKLTADETLLGKTHVYCNLNYHILGQLVQKASGLTYAEYVNKFIFTPCQMKNTFASYEQAKKYGFKNGYQYLFGYPINTTTKYSNNVVPAGDIASNADDLARFLQVLLQNGKTSTDSLLSSNALKQMHTAVSNRYGMGFSIGKWNGLPSVRHSGLTKNYSSAINILPEQNYGIVILTNINSFYAIHNLVDGVIIRLNNQEKISYPMYEMYVRYGILVLFVRGIIEFLMRLYKWKKHKFAFSFSKKPKILVRLLISIFMAVIWLMVIPIFFDIPASVMPLLQPDLGIALWTGAIVGICSSFVQYIVKSVQAKQNTIGLT